ncbi:hypothetical protein [Rhodanobacter glycinis]|nr:hypothetical protein [Rhodanobacter glycinis]
MSEGLRVAVASGLLGAGLTQCLVWIREALTSRRSRHYSALRLALMCEHYALDCASDIELRTGHHEVGESILPSGMKLPALPDFPGDIEFRSLPASLVEPVFSLGVEVRFSENALSHLSGLLDGDELVDEYLAVVANRGIQAWDLGSSIRKGAGLSKAVLNLGEWDFIALMKQYRNLDI